VSNFPISSGNSQRKAAPVASRKEGSGNIDGIHWINQFWVVVLNIFILWDLSEIIGV